MKNTRNWHFTFTFPIPLPIIFQTTKNKTINPFSWFSLDWFFSFLAFPILLKKKIHTKFECVWFWNFDAHCEIWNFPTTFITYQPISLRVLWHDLMNARFVWRAASYFKWWNVSKRSVKQVEGWYKARLNSFSFWSESHISPLYYSSSWFVSYWVGKCSYILNFSHKFSLIPVSNEIF